MYKLLLVDDEIDVREGLLHEIDWEAHGFTVVDTAENGREAMELVERLTPDVVLTDISMPFMDGLALSEWIRREYPNTRIVLLSGFDEFEYAQRAIKLEVEEYVLKPFDGEQITQTLDKVRARIEAEIARREDMELLREHYRTSLPVLRETFLASLLSRKLPHSQIAEKARTYGLTLEGASYIVSVASLQQFDDSAGSEDGASEARRVSSLRASGDLDLQLFAVLNIAEELWSKQGLGRVFIHQDHLVLIAISSEADPIGLLKETLTVLQDAIAQIDRFLKLSITIGVGEPVSKLAELKDGYEGALQALDYRVLEGSNRIIYIGDVERRFVNRLRFDELKEQELVRCLKVGTSEEVRQVVNELFDEIVRTEASYKDYQVYVIEMLTAVLKAAKDADADLEALFGGSGRIFAEIEQQESLAATRERFISLCTKLAQTISSSRQHSYKQLVQQAIDFTKANYTDSNISVNQVCSHLHISAGYFSSVFKKETKLTFVAYLMNIRMEAAKELLRTTELKAFEIAERVGFSDPNYFSFCFKKQVGISPKEYRNKSQEE
ncbi:two-component system response regulator YesN [Paenibacillus phyllosphaerae]|uniref:Two-component system response regulator YesN n=1 Tax=Paenibacillus phyllosphaerae TaxID=274593 RepID=A0A7W5B2V7_9BACL|nr:response regulator [Paenibacillus phyllosphaerae]MBB3112656.1 two-component system response regulator YesN [Paenibacillus phyllosphaerae]